jgi:hypothetical protein
MLMDDLCSFECPSPTAAGKAAKPHKRVKTTALTIGTNE